MIKMVEALSRTGSKNTQLSGIGKGAGSPSPHPKGSASNDVSPNRVPEAEKTAVVSSSGNVAVYCRFRPLNQKERDMGEQ